MDIKLEQKHIDIIAAPGHLIVTGGPGSGKTTISLLKARERCRTLKPEQEVLFLSFSRAAIRQILTRCKDLLSPAERKLIHVSTYHKFCLQVLEAHGRLLCGQRICFMYPNDERLRKSTFDGDWETERSRLSQQEGFYCFDLVAPAVAALFEQCDAVCTLFASKYPMVIVDEFQDTDDDQWRIIKKFLEGTDVFCLADPEQRIFEYRENVDPRRIEALREHIRPTEFDLGTDNHRSPTAGILQFADAILYNRAPLPSPPSVGIIQYHNSKSFPAMVHAAVVWIFSKLRQADIEHPSIAVLCRSNTLVSQLSAILEEEHLYKAKTLPPVEHDVLWDADLSAAAAQVVGSILEWPNKTIKGAICDTLRLIAHYYRIKNAETPLMTATDNARKYDESTKAIIDDKTPKIKAAKELASLATGGLKFKGNPVEDWRQARAVLQNIKPLNELFREARLVRLFRATDALGNGLSESWLKEGRYSEAANLVKRILDRERLLAADRDARGCVLMTMHKAKGKEFDGVVLVEGTFISQFFDTHREAPPYQRSRRLLRVAITRARSHIMLVRPRGALPLVGN